MDKKSVFFLRAAITILAGIAFVVHVLRPHLVDAVGAGLLIVIILPWLSPIVKSVEVTGIGKLELQVKEVEEKQTLLKEDVDGLRFLLSGFVTDWELVHLNKLATNGPFPFVKGPGRDDRFTTELTRLRDFGLIEKVYQFAMIDIPVKGDLKTYLRITQHGRDYLRLRKKSKLELSEDTKA